jgi:uncharacterized protein
VHGLWLELLAECGLAAAAILPAVLICRLERRGFADYGLNFGAGFYRRFLAGSLWGLASLTVLVTSMHAAGTFDLGGPVLHGFRILKFAGFWGVFFLAVGFYEEFLLRGYTLFTLSQAIGFWPAAVVLSLTFGAIHLENPGETWAGVGGAAIIGFFLCLTVRRTGNLWFGIGFHAFWDWGESYVYSVPDSGGMAPGHLLNSSLHGAHWLTGGSAGPEGSVLLVVLVALLWMAFARVYPEARYPPSALAKLRSAEPV